MSTWGPLAMMAGGGLLSGLGSMMGGASQGRAGRQARDYYGARTQEGMNRLGMLYYGPGNFTDYLAGTNVDYGGNFWPKALEGAMASGVKPDGMSDQEWQRIQSLKGDWDRMNSFVQGQGGPLIDQLRGLGTTAQTGGNSILSGYDQATKALMDQAGGIQSQARQMYQRNTGTLSGLGQQGWGNAMALSQGAENMAANYGQGARDVINSDFDKNQRNIADVMMAQLRSSGLASSTAGSGALSRALTQNEAERARANNDLSMGIADRVLAARGQTVGVQQNATNSMLGTLGQQFRQEQAAMPDLAGSQLSLLAQRYGGQTGLQQNNLAQQLQYQMLPIQATMGVEQSSVMNPWLGQNTSSYYPGNTGAGQAVGGFGNALASFGGYQYGQNNQLRLLQQLQQSGGNNPWASYGAYGPWQN